MPAFNEAPILKTPELTLMRSADGSLSNQMPPSTASAKLVFPLIVYSHGLGGMRTDSCSVCCDLASHGYIVGAVEHRCVRVQYSHPTFSLSLSLSLSLSCM